MATRCATWEELGSRKGKHSEGHLSEFFYEFGCITSIKVLVDFQRRRKGFGFVAFSTLKEAGKAIDAMIGWIMEHKHLYVAIAQRKEERKSVRGLYFLISEHDEFPYVIWSWNLPSRS
ncbi:hypothetical protein ACFE04_012166 [Oxalis oulophora]